MALPSGFVELEYIGLTGTQYIDTGFKANRETRVVVDFKASSVHADGTFIFGARAGVASNACAAALMSNGRAFYDFAKAYNFVSFSSIYERITLNANKVTAYFTAESGVSATVSTSITAATFTTPYNLVLGSCNNAGTVYTGSAAFVGEIYSCQIYDNGTLIRDFVPCKNASGVVGMYDIVNNVFYGNSGTGAFIAGAEIRPVYKGFVKIGGALKQLTGEGYMNKSGILYPITASSKVKIDNVLKSLLIGTNPSRLPAGYTEVEYIESTGTQYISTGVSPTTSLKTEIVITPNSSAISENGIFGSTWAANGYFLMFYQSTIRWHSRGASVDVSNFNKTAQNTIVCTPTGITVNGTLYSISGTQTDSTTAISLFGGISGYANAVNGKFKLHSCKMYNGSTLVRDFVPCKNASGVAGLYDLVNDKFYSNSGTGSFGAGAEV